MFEVFGVNFYWYGLLVGVGVWLAIEISMANSGSLNKKILERVIACGVFSGLLGARVYHVVDFWDRYYSSNIVRVFYLWEGGLGIWGAVTGGVLGVFLFCYVYKLKFYRILDILVLGMPLAQAIGRVGNFINGELLGRDGRPIWIYEGTLSFLLFVFLWIVSRKKRKDGLVSGIYFAGYGLIRVLLENLRPDDLIWKIYSIPTAIIFGVFAIVYGGALIFRRRQF